MSVSTALASTAGRWRRRAVVRARRALEIVGGRRSIVALGGLFLLTATVQVVAYLLVGQVGAATVAVTFVLVAAPAVGLLYGGSRLPRADLHPDFHATIAGWCLASFAAMAAGLSLFELQPGDGFSNALQSIPVLLALGSFAGFAAGVHDARARTRARELSHRNHQLERTREELEATVEQLRSSNERLEQFAYAASHDLQEPLRMVSSYLQLVENRYADDLDHDGEEYVAFAVDGADRMRSMIEGLLAYSRVETEGRPLEPVDLNEVLADVRADLQLRIDRHDATVAVEDLPTVEGDASQLRQVFQNLLDNAIEYCGDEPPRVHVSAGSASAAAAGTVADGVETGADAGSIQNDVLTDDYWTIAVRDEGIGVEAEYTDRIFEVFQRLHSREEHEGTGIGLALCQRIVDRHGGDLWVESDPGDGSTFFVALPVPADDESTEDAAENEDGVPEDAADADDAGQTDAAMAEH